MGTAERGGDFNKGEDGGQTEKRGIEKFEEGLPRARNREPGVQSLANTFFAGPKRREVAAGKKRGLTEKGDDTVGRDGHARGG